MKKAEFLDLVAKNGNYNKTESAKVLDSILNSITEVLSKGDTINFIGFGAFLISPCLLFSSALPLTPIIITTITAIINFNLFFNSYSFDPLSNKYSK